MRVEIKKLSLRSLGLVALICLTIVPAVRGQQGITSILNLHYPSQAVLENGVAVVPVTFEMYFNYYSNPQGYLVFGVYNAGTLNPVPGSAASSPNPCQSLAGTPYANDAVCAMIPAVGAGGSGTESASLNLTLNQPQAYSLSVVAFVWDSRDLQSGNQVSGSSSTSDFTVTVTGQTISTTTTMSSNVSETAVTSSFTQGNVSQPISNQSLVTSSANSTTEVPPSTPSPGLNDIMSTLSQNTPSLTGAVIVLVVLLAGVMLRRRKPRGGPATGTRPKKGIVYCMECGAQNSATNRFCEKCGAKLES